MDTLTNTTKTTKITTTAPGRVALLERAYQKMPTTAEGIPVGYYRVDMLPQQPGSIQEEVAHLRAAYQDLHFTDGYPTFADGRPFWSRFDFEPGFAFGCFEMYLEQGSGDRDAEGLRNLGELSRNPELLNLGAMHYSDRRPSASQERSDVSKPKTEAAPQTQAKSGAIRVIPHSHSHSQSAQAPKESEIAPPRADDKWFTQKELASILNEYATLYQWRSRAKAYDLYCEAAYRHKRFKRQGTVEERHYLMASKLLERLEAQVLNGDDFFENMDPKVALDMLNKLVAIQRVSVGLPASGPLAPKDEREETSFEMILRTLGRRANIQDAGGGRTVAGQSEVLSRVLETPESTSQMQELVIKVTKASQQQEPSSARRFKGRERSEQAINAEDLEAYDVTGAPGAHDHN